MPFVGFHGFLYGADVRAFLDALGSGLRGPASHDWMPGLHISPSLLYDYRALGYRDTLLAKLEPLGIPAVTYDAHDSDSPLRDDLLALGEHLPHMKALRLNAPPHVGALRDFRNTFPNTRLLVRIRSVAFPPGDVDAFLRHAATYDGIATDVICDLRERGRFNTDLASSLLARWTLAARPALLGLAANDGAALRSVRRAVGATIFARTSFDADATVRHERGLGTFDPHAARAWTVAVQDALRWLSPGDRPPADTLVARAFLLQSELRHVLTALGGTWRGYDPLVRIVDLQKIPWAIRTTEMGMVLLYGDDRDSRIERALHGELVTEEQRTLVRTEDDEILVLTTCLRDEESV